MFTGEPRQTASERLCSLPVIYLKSLEDNKHFQDKRRAEEQSSERRLDGGEISKKTKKANKQTEERKSFKEAIKKV